MNVRNLKVLQLGKFYPIRGGVEKVAFDLMKGLSEKGIECHMLCAAEEGDNRTILLNEHGRLICTRTWVKVCATMISPSMIFTLRKICRGYDIIHMKEELQNEITSLNLQNEVKLLGRVSDEDLPAYYGACDVFCMSSVLKTEAFGIVQIEAMSCGKPIVATRIPQSGVAWVNEEGVSGMNAEPGDAQDLARVIRAVTENVEVYRNFSVGAAKRYREMFTKERMIEKCLTIYLEL